MSRPLREVYARQKRRKLSPEEMSKAMKALGLTDAKLAEDIGARPSRVVAWRKGEEDIPDMLALLLAAWTVPGALTRSRAAAQHLMETASETPLGDL